jgi:MraZ protein
LPQSLIDFSAIKKDVTIIGVLNKIEIWNPNLLRKIDQSDEIDDQSYEELSERVNI